MRKKLLTLLAILTLSVCSMLLCISVSAAYNDFTLAVEAGEVEEDGTVNVDVMIYNNPGITGADFSIAFDNSKIQVIDYDKYLGNDDIYYPTTCFTGDVAYSNIQQKSESEYSELSKVTFLFSSGLKDYSENGSLMNLIFKLCEGVDTADITISITDPCINTQFDEYTPNLVSESIVRYQEVQPDYTGSCGENVTYALYIETGLLKIEGTGAMTNYSAPWYSYCTDIKTVIIENGVTSIGDDAFSGCSSLTSVTFETKNTTINSSAFNACNNLKTIYLYRNSTADTYFSSDKYTKIYLDEEDTSPESDFEYKVNADGKTVTITKYVGEGGEVIIPATISGYSVTSIGNRAFESCRSLTSVTIPDSVTSIGNDAFWFCSSLTSVTIGNSVTSIGSWAFEGCSSLTSVTIPDSVTSIGSLAFKSCSSLTSVTIGNSVTSIGSWAFEGCSSLTAIEVDENNAYYCDIDGVLFNKDKTTIISYPAGGSTTYIIPDIVMSIGNYAFSWCSSLTSVTIPDSVTSIGERAFSWCSSLTAIEVDENNAYYCDIDGVLFNKDKTTIISYPAGGSTTYIIPDSVMSIGDLAFYDCSNLTSVTIPDSVTSIGDYAFSWCSSLTSVTIPDSVTSIGEWAFEDCSKLTSIYVVRNSYGETWALENYPDLVKYIMEIPETADEFLTFDGYQVRENKYNGLRSRFVVNFNGLKNFESKGWAVLEYGTILASTDKLSQNGDDFTVFKGENGSYGTLSYAKIFPIYKDYSYVGKYFSFDENELVYYCTVTNFNANNYDKAVSIRGYAVIADAEGNEYVVYADYPIEEYRSVSLKQMCLEMEAEGKLDPLTCISYLHVKQYMDENGKYGDNEIE